MACASHILSCATRADAGGVERALFRLAREWGAAGRRVTILLADRTPGPDIPGVTLVRVPGPMALSLPKLVRAAQPDLLFCPGNHYTSRFAWTRMRLGRSCPPIVAKMSNAPDRGDHRALAAVLHACWLRSHPRFVAHLVAMTPATAAQAAAATGMAGRMSVIANPPNRPGAGPGAPVAMPPGPVILGVGRLVPQKRWDRLVAALPRLGDRAARLVILGDGPLRDALIAQARRLGVAHRFCLPGPVADPFPAMTQATVLALPSDFEGVPGVLREALSVGTPVIATDASPAIREIVAEGLGTVVSRDNPAALVAALDRWLSPGAVRPAPVPPPGADSAERYLALFDRLVG